MSSQDEELWALMEKTIDFLAKEEIPINEGIMSLIYTSASIASNYDDKPEMWIATCKLVAQDVWESGGQFDG